MFINSPQLSSIIWLCALMAFSACGGSGWAFLRPLLPSPSPKERKRGPSLHLPLLRRGSGASLQFQTFCSSTSSTCKPRQNLTLHLPLLKERKRCCTSLINLLTSISTSVILFSIFVGNDLTNKKTFQSKSPL